MGIKGMTETGTRLMKKTKPLGGAPEFEAAEDMSHHKEHTRADSSITRVLDVITLFSDERPKVRVEDVVAHIGCSQASAYRYIYALCNIGLLSAMGGGNYALGPRIVELDRVMQRTDPLVRAGQMVLPAMTAAMPNTVLRLCSLYGDKVICVHSEGPETIIAEGRAVELLQDRGVPVPLFRNAASLAILAFLPPQRIQNLYLEYAEPIREVGMGDNWKAFKANLTAVKRAGFAFTAGRHNSSLAAVSLPIMPPEGAQNFGSLTRVVARDWFETADVDALVENMREGVAEIESLMRDFSQ